MSCVNQNINTIKELVLSLISLPIRLDHGVNTTVLALSRKGHDVPSECDTAIRLPHCSATMVLKVKRWWSLRQIKRGHKKTVKILDGFDEFKLSFLLNHNFSYRFLITILNVY